MSEIAIRVQNLGKRFTIGRSEQYKTLAEGLTHAVRAPFRAVAALARGQWRRQRQADNAIWALEDVSFEVQHGEVVGVIGRNGAGKSTLLKILSRITAPTRGQAEIHGRVGSLLEVGTGFHPELTGRENIYLNGAILGMKRVEIAKKFDEMVEFSEIGRFIDTPVKQYSSGMYLRLAFAVAAHMEPEILLVDEVLAVGDAAFQKKCLGKMSDVAHQGRTVLFVSHNMAAMRSLCSAAVLLNRGKVEHMGPTGEVIDRYIAGLSPPLAVDAPYLARNEELDLTLKSVDLLDGRGQTVPAMQVGQPATLRLRLESSRSYESLLMSITVSTLEDYSLYLFHTGVSGFESRLTPPGVEIHCTLPKIPLRPGRYRLGIKCGVGGTVAFYLPYAVEVDVESGDFYGNGRLPREGWSGACLTEHVWRAVPLADQ